MNILPTPKIQDFVNSLDKPTIQKIAKTLDLLEEFGNKLTMPHSKYISNNLFELRIRGKQEIRIFYSFKKENIYLLHGFVKKSQKIPSHEIKHALLIKLTLDI